MSKKILIIDDEAVVIQLTKKVLEKHGYEVISCMSAEEAQNVIENEQPDLIILDNILPGKNGSELCHEIKSNPLFSSIPILMTTGQNLINEVFIQNQNLVKPNDILIKPFESDDLVVKVRKLLK